MGKEDIVSWGGYLIQLAEAEKKMPHNEIEYEWCVEHTDEYGDIHDIAYSDKLSTLSLTTNIPGTHPVICLVRSLGNDEDGLLDRTYAYPTEDGKLTPTFSGGHPVPDKYDAEYFHFIILHNVRRQLKARGRI